MAYRKKAYAPFSLSSEAGNTVQPVDGYIEVDQYIQPTVNTGVIDEKGTWRGTKASDSDFIGMRTDSGIANGANFITPTTNADGTWPLDMTGFSDLFIAIKPSAGGAYAVKAIMGPDSVSFANLSPVNAGSILRGNVRGSSGTDFGDVILDSSETLVVDVWNIFFIQDKLQGQKLLQFDITNNTGSSSDIETAFMRIV